MPNNRPPPITVDDEELTPPQPRFTQLDEDSRPVTHSRNTSNAQSLDTPPISPNSVAFSLPVNPFSPASSLRNFPMDSPAGTPGGRPGTSSGQSSFPGTPRTANSDLPSSPSVYALPRTSSFYGSRPTTADYSVTSFSRASRLRETFASPPSRPVTIYSSPSTLKLQRERPKSTMITDTTRLEKPWLHKKDSSATIAYYLTYAVMFLGVAAAALRCYFDWQSVPDIKGNLCPVLIEEFDSEDGIFGENGKFMREVDMSGFGNGEFEMTTSSSKNSFVRDGRLYIMPTLTSDILPMDQILDDHIFNITDCTFNITRGLTYTSSSSKSGVIAANTSAIGDDTFDAEGYYKACSAVSNSTSGTIINPIQTARLTTRKTASIKYGKVEVRAKIPRGDWMWPAIWMLPVDNVYGGWPASGEIDIMESRGNGPKYIKQGRDYVRGSLNWGPTVLLNAVAKTTGWWKLRRGGYDQDFHTYILEWTEDFVRISVDSRLHHMLDFKIKNSFWNLGDFPGVVRNGTDDIVLPNPWKDRSKSAPFDQRFYLILSLGIGGTNGWFPDHEGKPWLDGSPTAPRDFLQAKDTWYPTWPENTEDRAFVIDSVKMWQRC